MTTAIRGLTTRAGRDWADRSACRGIHGYTEMPEDEQQAFCDTCPVVEQCRDYGVQIHLERGEILNLSHEIGGVFGGLTPDQLTAEIRLVRKKPRTTACLRCGQHRPGGHFPSGGRICGNCPPNLPADSALHGTARGYLAGCECTACLAGRPLRSRRAAYLEAELAWLLPRWRPDLIARHLGYPNTEALLRSLTLARLPHLALRLRARADEVIRARTEAVTS